MNATHALRLVTASFVALASLAGCAEDEDFRSVEDQVELAVDTVEGQFPGYTVNRDALAQAIEAAAEPSSYAPPPVGPCPPTGPQDVAEPGHGEPQPASESAGLWIDHGGPIPVDPVVPTNRDDGEEDIHPVIPLEILEEEEQARPDPITVVDPVHPISLAGPERTGRPEGEGFVLALSGADTVEAPELDECLELCVSDYAGCSGRGANELICADEISACVEDCL